jgi:phosphoglycerate dehydrogenase-like enzyme
MKAVTPTPRTLLLAGRYSQVFKEPLLACLGPGWVAESWCAEEGTEGLTRKAAVAEILIGSAEWARHAQGLGVEATFAASRRLGLTILPFSGVDWLRSEWVPANSVVCNVSNGSDPIAEYVMGAILNAEIPFREMDAELRQHRWTWGGGSVVGRRHGELQGKTIGLVGYGRIGQRVAQLATAFRMQTIAVSRSPGVSRELHWWRGMEALPTLLAQSDYVLLCVPGGAETLNLIDKDELSRMKSNAILINVARGPVVNEASLFAALQRREIRGAIVDTWYTYPPPSSMVGAPGSLAFETLDNLVMTPHAAGWTDALETRRVETVVRNVHSYLHREALTDVVIDKRSAASECL